MRFSNKAGVAVLAAASMLLAGCGDDGSPSAGSTGGGGDSSLTWWVMKGTNPDASAFYAEAKKQFKKETGATLSVLDIERRSHELLVQSFHLFDETQMVIKTQAPNCTLWCKAT